MFLPKAAAIAALCTATCCGGVKLDGVAGSDDDSVVLLQDARGSAEQSPRHWREAAVRPGRESMAAALKHAKKQTVTRMGQDARRADEAQSPVVMADPLVSSLSFSPSALSMLSNQVGDGFKVYVPYQRGRLGNRMFEWAAVLAIAKETGGRVVIPPSNRYRPDVTPQMARMGSLVWSSRAFRGLYPRPENTCQLWDNLPVTVNYNIPKIQEFSATYSRKGVNSYPYDEVPGKGEDWSTAFANAIRETQTPMPCHVYEFDGFWQRVEFFQKHTEFVRDLFYHEETASKAKRVLQKLLPGGLKDKDDAAVAVHFRLADYLKHSRSLPLSYYEKALQTIKSKRGVNRLTCVIFSDDIVLAQEIVAEMGTLCDRRIPVRPCKDCDEDERVDEYVSFYMMGQIPNIVIADSTYSWWAAFLSQRNPIVVAPYVTNPGIVLRHDYDYLNSPVGWLSVNATIGDPTISAVRKFLNFNKRQTGGLEQDLASIMESEWGA